MLFCVELMFTSEIYYKLLIFLCVVGIGMFLRAGLKADFGHSFWATRCLKCGAAILLFISLFAWVFFESNDSSGGAWVFVSVIFLLSSLVLIVGVFGFCSRFGSTCRRITELQELATALSAASAREKEEELSTLEKNRVK